jgi:hypothetical protein
MIHKSGRRARQAFLDANLRNYARSLARRPIDVAMLERLRANHAQVSRPVPGKYNICPSLLFCEAVLRVTGEPDCSPRHVFAAVREYRELVRAVFVELWDAQTVP